MKAGWETLRLGELGRVFNGNSISEAEKKKSFAGQLEGLPYIATKDVGFDSSINFESGVRIPEGKQSDFKLAPANTVLVCAEGGSAGRKIAHSDKQICFGNKLFAISPNHPHSSRFVFYYCLSNYFSKQFRAAMAGLIGGVSINKFKELTIQLPAAAEQHRIVSILDEAFAGIATAHAAAEQSRQNARALFESHLQSIFTQRGEEWVERPLGTLCSFLNGYAFKSDEAISVSNTQLLRMGNLYGNKLDLERSSVFYPDSYAKEYSRFVLNPGDLVMSLTGTTGKEDYGFAVQIPETDRTLLLNQRIVKFDSIKEDQVLREYLLHYLRSRVFLDLLYPTANGTRQANLSTVTMSTLPIGLCSITEQKSIVASLNKLQEETQCLESLYQQKLAALDALKQSLLHQAFSGQL